VDDPIVAGLSSFNLLDSNINSYVWLSRIAAIYYFAYFLLITPMLGLRETPLPVPESISTPVLSHPAAAPAGAAAAPEQKG
jgi:ubiquinol-cytochrome c reductase cytochrome b subunit